MQSAELISEESKIHFQEAINRVMSISLIHQKLHQGESLSKINLNQYTKELAQDLVLIFDSGKILNSKLKQMMFW
jgi:two-component sensor histidine kinase